MPGPEADLPDIESVSDAVSKEGGADDGAMDALIAASRVHRGTVMDDAEYQPLSDSGVGRISKAISDFLLEQEDLPKGQRVTRARLAEAVGESKSTVSQVLSSTYPKGKLDGYRKRDEALRLLNKHIALLKARRESPHRGGFAWTSVAEEVRGVANTAVMLGGMGVVYGPAGIGKTLTLEALLDVYPGSVLVTIDDESHSPTTFLRTLSGMLKLGSARHRQSMRKSIREALLQSKRLVMVDEAHLAGLDTLTTIRQIQDKTHSPILLCGLPALPRAIMRGRGDDSKGATLYSRIGVSRDLTERSRNGADRGEPLFSVNDIRKVFARSGLRIASDGMNWLQELASMPEAGGLRGATNAVRLAAEIARQEGEPQISLTRLLQASRLLHGIERAQSIVNQIKQRQSRVV